MWAYISCPACYEAERILRVPKPMSADLMVGRFAHAALAHMRQHLVDGAEVLELQHDTSTTVHGVNFEDAVEVGSEAFDRVITEQIDREETGEETPIEIELTKKYTDLGAAKDVAAKLTRYSLPLIAKWDATAGVIAAEARVRHLGTSLYGTRAMEHATPAEIEDWRQEEEEQVTQGVEPCFPFPVRAYLDVLYASPAIKDAKTSSRAGPPDNLARLQLCMYGMPWYSNDEPIPLGFDVLIKTKNPDCRSYWLKSELDESLPPGVVTREEMDYVRWRVLKAADGICAGDFPPHDGSLFCRYNHGLPGAEPAANWPGMEIAV